MRRGALLAALLAALAGACGEGAPAAVLPARPPVQHLLLDGEHVELLEGFGAFTRLEAWADPSLQAPDREELLVRLPRNARLRWHVELPPDGELRLGALRFPFGGEADEGPCRLVVRRLGADGAAREPALIDVGLPAAPADPAARPGAWREGPSLALTARRSETLHGFEFEVVSEGAPANALVALLAPRVVCEPPAVPLAERPVPWPAVSRRLMARLEPPDAEPVPLLDWRAADAAEAADLRAAGLPVEGSERVAPVREEGAFLGYKPRHALGLVGGAVARWTLADLGGLHLRGAVALDQRMPPGSRAAFVVRVDGHEVARLPVTDSHWHAVDADLGLPADDAGPHELELALEPVALGDGEVRVMVPDFVVGKERWRLVRPRALRAGFAEPRLESTHGSVARRAASAEQPSLLLVHVETLRADVLGGAGVPAELTPNLRRLAAAGVDYTRAVAPSPWTLPSSATLFTGLSPSSHGVVAHDRAVLPDGVPTLAERLLEAGWITAGFVTNTLLNGHAGWSRGFTEWAELPYAQMRQVGGLARDWVAAQGDGRWFVFLHPYDPHGPHHAPGEFLERFVEPALRGRDAEAAAALLVQRMKDGEPLDPGHPAVRLLRQRYWGDVAYLDRELGRLLAALDEQGVLDTTVVVLTADHGEEFGEFGLWGHGSNLHDPSTRVPLVLAPPGALTGWAAGDERGEGRTVTQLVSTDGLHATLIGVLGLDPSATATPLRPPLGRQDGAPAWIETDKARAPAGERDPLRRSERAVRSATHLLVRRFPVEGETDAAGAALTAPEDHLWVLDDPSGAARRVPAEGPEYERLAAFLQAQLGRVREQAVRAPGAGGDGDRLRALEALGYLDGGHDAQR